MGKTERASFHCACRGLSDRAGAGIFSVVIVLLTAVSPPSRRGLARIERPPLCVLRDIARPPPLLPPGVLHHLPRSRRILPSQSQRWRESLQALDSQIPQPR